MPFELRNVRRDMPERGKVTVYWLGGAGYVFKFSDGQIVCVDPYLSDYCERVSDGEFRRLCLAPIKSSELIFDILLLTHEHGDHMDVDGFDDFIRNNPACRILAPKCCSSFLENKQVKYETIHPGTVSKAQEITITAVNCDHGHFSPDAVGFILTFSGRSIYITGDCSYNIPLLEDVIKSKPEIIIPCINGAFGNLSELQAAALTGQCSSKLAIPTHFGLFVQHGGCPRRFSAYLKTSSPKTELVSLTPGLGKMI